MTRHPISQSLGGAIIGGKGDTYCRFVCSFEGILLTAEKLNGPFTVSVERADSAPVEPWRFPSELLLLRRVILLARLLHQPIGKYYRQATGVRRGPGLRALGFRCQDSKVSRDAQDEARNDAGRAIDDDD